MEKIILYDKKFFYTINHDWSNPFFDSLMPLLRNSSVWVPLYLFLILLITINYRKNSLWWIIYAAGTAILTDFLSSDLCKNYFDRIRPCNDPAYSSWIHILVGYKPQSFSFTSSHATNHFGLAMFLYLTLYKHFRVWPSLFFVWAFLISFAQVYVGVHYPGDVIAGAILGCMIGYMTAKLFNHNFGLQLSSGK